MNKLLQIVDLRKHFLLHILNSKVIGALDGVSLEMEEGEVLALTGKSGSGKSSLMKCIYRTYLPNSGQMLYTTAAGEIMDLATAPDQEILKIRKLEMNYCTQFLHVIPRVPAVDVAAAALKVRGVAQDDARRSAQQCFERLSLPQELWDAYPATFSGGEQQRVNIARAILSRPRLLLVDEPTSSLDLKTKDAVIDMILELRDSGTSVILITHDQHTLQRMGGRSLFLENGKLREPAYV